MYNRGPFVIVTEFKNGSCGERSFKTYYEAMEYARNGISYPNVSCFTEDTGSPTQLISVSLEIEGDQSFCRNLWNAAWTPESQVAGLRNAP